MSKKLGGKFESNQCLIFNRAGTNLVLRRMKSKESVTQNEPQAMHKDQLIHMVV
jgi:hypothetical protein